MLTSYHRLADLVGFTLNTFPPAARRRPDRYLFIRFGFVSAGDDDAAANIRDKDWSKVDFPPRCRATIQSFRFTGGVVLMVSCDAVIVYQCPLIIRGLISMERSLICVFVVVSGAEETKHLFRRL